jgi:hypothetical protein
METGLLPYLYDPHSATAENHIHIIIRSESLAIERSLALMIECHSVAVFDGGVAENLANLSLRLVEPQTIRKDNPAIGTGQLPATVIYA